MKVQLVVRSYRQMIGLARYTLALCDALTEVGFGYELAEPQHPWIVRAGHRLLARLGLDVRTFFTTYPVSAGPLDGTALTHLTAQQMATLLWFKPRLRPAVVTVHDIVPFLVRRDEDQSTFRHPLDLWFDRLAMSGLKRADVVISDSHFTKKTVVQALGYPAEKISVVPLAVAHQVFRPLAVSETFYQRHGLDPEQQHILYVGSENPRKNLPRLVRAFSHVREVLPAAKLIKIGSPQYGQQAVQLRQLIQREGLNDHVLFYDHVSDEDLALFYNVADLFVFPSLYEGFGLPPLEAMACGIPVVCSNAASLPEVVGDAALLVDPTDEEAIAEAILRVLDDKGLQADLREAGLQRAAGFTWERTAQETLTVYRDVWDS